MEILTKLISMWRRIFYIISTYRRRLDNYIKAHCSSEAYPTERSWFFMEIFPLVFRDSCFCLWNRAHFLCYSLFDVGSSSKFSQPTERHWGWSWGGKRKGERWWCDGKFHPIRVCMRAVSFSLRWAQASGWNEFYWIWCFLMISRKIYLWKKKNKKKTVKFNFDGRARDGVSKRMRVSESIQSERVWNYIMFGLSTIMMKMSSVQSNATLSLSVELIFRSLISVIRNSLLLSLMEMWIHSPDRTEKMQKKRENHLQIPSESKREKQYLARSRHTLWLES